MEHGYTDEKNIQMLIGLLKAHGIKKIIISPGTTNLTFVASVQYDSWFELYSSVDERSAAYMACGLAAESGEPVCLSCTGATASRNYIPGLTEAFYRKLPVLALTSSQPISRIGSLSAQMLDRTNPLNDICVYSATIPFCNTPDEEWDCSIKINNGILALKRHGGGPVILNIQQKYSKNFSVKELCAVNKIERYTYTDLLESKMPVLPKGKIAVWVGNHKKMKEKLANSIDSFCMANNAVVFTDSTSGYYGKYRLNYSIVEHQLFNDKEIPDLLIHIGEVSGAYYGHAKNVWRVNPDGELRDLFQKLRNVFEMEESYFFDYYAAHSVGAESSEYFTECNKKLIEVRSKIPDLSFSNMWCASKTAHRIPKGSAVFLGILNSLRCWNCFDFSEGVDCYSNTGGFGIDGGISSAIGASFTNIDRLYFCITGDLSFFYDMNSLGNRYVGKNFRLMLVNNGKGTEFRNFSHPGSAFGDDADKFIAAGGHYGNKSPVLVKHYCEDLGFEYLTASNKEEYLQQVERFVTPEITDKPILFEIFTESQDESDAIESVYSIDVSAKGEVKNMAKRILGEKGVKSIKKILRK